jgi:serine/threonine-protein kinase HipA
VLIGNCDAHGKNYSLLYDSPAPSLAPLYDLVSTAMYDELTTRLAMSIDGATMLEEVTIEAWQQLAKEVGFAPRFLELRMEPFLTRVLEASAELAGRDEYADAAVETIARGVREQAKRFRLPR